MTDKEIEMTGPEWLRMSVCMPGENAVLMARIDADGFHWNENATVERLKYAVECLYRNQQESMARQTAEHERLMAGLGRVVAAANPSTPKEPE